MRKYILILLTFLVFNIACIGQANDTCSIAPSGIAKIDGITVKGMMSTEDLPRVKKLIAEETGLKIVSFVYSIDCDNCDIISRRVYGDIFSEEDIKVITAIKSKQILSFECIAGTNKKGELITFKPFLFYIR